MDKIYLLQDEFDMLVRQREVLQERLRETATLMNEAISQSEPGGHDNAPYDVALNENNLVRGQIKNVQEILSHGRVISIATENTMVAIGKKVKFLVDGNEFSCSIGGFNGIIKGRVGYNSPLVQHIIGKRVGDIVEDVLVSNRQIDEIIVLSIEDM